MKVSFLFFVSLFLHNVPIARNSMNANDTAVTAIMIFPTVDSSSSPSSSSGMEMGGRLTLNKKNNNLWYNYVQPFHP